MNKTLLFLLAATALSAEEGMWPFNNIPVETIRQQYGVTLQPSWVDHVQKSCLRVSLGGSASFVSPNGLLLTNHHVGRKAVYDLSTEEKDLGAQGFLAKSLKEELQCPNMYVDQLISIRDVTAEVHAAAEKGTTAAEREQLRKAAIAALVQQAQEETGLQPEMVSLYEGGRYNLYLYQRYSDIRLVMAPEDGIAFFGGDSDNFEYPRYDLDICFFRVYQDGKPLTTEHYLNWEANGPKPGEPLFVAGHPGHTSRMLTAAHIRFLQEVHYAILLKWLEARREDLQEFASESAENRRICSANLFSVENSLKVFKNLCAELNSSSLIADKQAYEDCLCEDVDAQPWTVLEASLEDARGYYPTYMALERYSYGKLYAWAKHLVRLVAERTKPNESRLEEYVDAELTTLKQGLLSTEPVYNNLERIYLEGSFQRTIQLLGADHPVSQILQATSIDDLLAASQLKEPAAREWLYDHPEEVLNSSDPLIQLAIALDPYAREVRQKVEDEFESIQHECYAAIAKILFDRYGESVYPDATFTLRLSVGSMSGYEDQGNYIEPTTMLGATFEHARAHDFQGSYALPQSWLAKQDLLINKRVPFNFVSTNDIIGGNSGSPVINQYGEFVGLIFDGNIQSIVWDFGFDSVQGRATSVHSAGILEALRTVYGADSLVQEITTGAGL